MPDWRETSVKRGRLPGPLWGVCAARVRAEEHGPCPKVHSPAIASPERSRFRREGSKADRKSTRLNSSHGYISYAVFCLKKKKKSKRRSLYRVRLMGAT